ncbi:hypothetical protein ATDW_26090 [Asticcacaulis sp. DW145]|uniref:hypothetical protein n=1 Tax=Asticcacaulis sp. DW145 TaxID=3095608 RepID=UPI003093C792|nr:hypothetical protein ATDW_26090 [Asticcacaulis sp. DW145]
MKYSRFVFAVAALFAQSAPAYAVSQSVNNARITLVEPTYMPSFVAFKIDKAAGACAAGQFLKWYGSGADPSEKRDNVLAIYSAVLTAMAGGRAINLGVDDATCSVTVFQII